MTNDELDKWLANWSRWLRDGSDCYPKGYGAAGIEGQYRSPQRWHHGTPPPTPPPVYPVQAERVEMAVHGNRVERPGYRALAAEWVLLPAHTLAAQRINADLWPLKRAYRAGMAYRTYVEASGRARAVLASILAPYRGQLP